MKANVEQSDRRFLQRLNRLGPSTVSEICGEVGVTATAVRQRLTRLQSLRFVCRETVRSLRGRPHHTYRVTEAGQREIGDNYSDLALILWRELRGIEETAVRQRVFNRVQEALVSEYGRLVDGNSMDERIEQLRTALVDRGFDVELDSSGSLPILRENNCPYLDLASSDKHICELEQAVFGRVLGADVTLTQCCLDGHHCCEFEAAANRSAVD